MEILRDLGIEQDALRLSTGPEHMMHTSWLDNLMGNEFGRIYAWGNKPADLSNYTVASPCHMSDLPQSYLEPLIVDKAIQAGARFYFYHEVVDFNVQGDDVVSVVIKDRETDKKHNLRCKYLIGADGARSIIASKAGLKIEGQKLNDAFNVHIKADLSHLFAHRPGSLNWILNVDAEDWSAVGNFRLVRPWNEFVVSMHPSLQGNDAQEQTDPSMDQIRHRLHQMIGDVDLPADQQVHIEVVSSYRWTINDQHAKQWQHGPVLCIGDAVHRHPPINGLGSNTCIGDAFNLGWKLAYVLKGLAHPDVLSTLTQERAPVGQAIVHRANEGMRAHRHLWSLLGLTKERRLQVLTTLRGSSVESMALREAIKEAMEATDLEVQSIGIQMNQFYHNVGSQLCLDEKPEEQLDTQSDRTVKTTGGPVTILDATRRAALSTEKVPLDYNTLKDVVLSTAPGFHMPHCWIARGGQSPSISTLDLCGKGKFTLITGCAGQAWLDAVKSLTQRIPTLPLVAVTVDSYSAEYQDLYYDWVRLRDMEAGGMLLVRPDHFIAARVQRSQTSPEKALERLEEMLTRLLGQPISTQSQ
ncbi:hypothetical protein PHSY_002729 [Pseudozyma hubeiensis SY62]|uniref:FAD-binding domain-containing protein n=1 Tax=Pseudozyma hubeiensis (strain SY62) TaxID=1305764 RepID=R9P1S2_PSEHS|nr:hypothetical protein PHSY_002729 [Pseudozyma hubeiensis SY62]GAC95154.1 hypothetical protein PHSY_002729 [Pseudozyma hubeiensis SY62]